VTLLRSGEPMVVVFDYLLASPANGAAIGAERDGRRDFTALDLFCQLRMPITEIFLRSLRPKNLGWIDTKVVIIVIAFLHFCAPEKPGNCRAEAQ
jgi:hypothetical protein